MLKERFYSYDPANLNNFLIINLSFGFFRPLDHVKALGMNKL